MGDRQTTRSPAAHIYSLAEVKIGLKSLDVYLPIGPAVGSGRPACNNVAGEVPGNGDLIANRRGGFSFGSGISWACAEHISHRSFWLLFGHTPSLHTQHRLDARDLTLKRRGTGDTDCRRVFSTADKFEELFGI